MGTRWVAACALALVTITTGCDDADGPAGRLVAAEITADALPGFWTGVARVTDGFDEMSALRRDGPTSFGFPVALELRRDRGFVLRAVNFPVAGGGLDGDRFCTGVYNIAGRFLEFYPDHVCRALPLHRYTVGRFVPDGLLLEAESTPARLGAGQFENITVRVLFRLERS
jgi:hypothetical protein